MSIDIIGIISQIYFSKNKGELAGIVLDRSSSYYYNSVHPEIDIVINKHGTRLKCISNDSKKRSENKVQP